MGWVYRSVALMLASRVGGGCGGVQRRGHMSPPLCNLQRCGPLNVSASGHYLTYRDGTPFWYVADTPWHLLQDVSLAEAKQFVDIRLSQGFTVLQLNALGMVDGPNAAGDWFGNWTSLNPKYWDHVHEVLEYMETHGMVAYIVPIWAYNWACHGTGKCPSGLPSASLADHRTFGQALGARWSSLGNVIWALGGDITNPPIPKYRCVESFQAPEWCASQSPMYTGDSSR